MYVYTATARNKFETRFLSQPMHTHTHTHTHTATARNKLETRFLSSANTNPTHEHPTHEPYHVAVEDKEVEGVECSGASSRGGQEFGEAKICGGHELSDSRTRELAVFPRELAKEVLECLMKETLMKHGLLTCC